MCRLPKFGVLVLICLSIPISFFTPWVLAENLGANRPPLAFEEGGPLLTHEAIQRWIDKEVAEHFALGQGNQLHVSERQRSIGESTVVAVTQTFDGKPVIGGETRLVLDKNNAPQYLFGRHLDVVVDQTGGEYLTVEKAARAVKKSSVGQSTERVVYWFDGVDKFHLALELEGEFIEPNFQYAPARVYIDMQTGEELERQTLVHSKMVRHVYDFKAACNEKGINYPLISPTYELVERLAVSSHNRSENGPASTNAVVEQGFDLLGEGYEFIEDILNMSSIDDQDLPLRMFVNVHFQENAPTIQCYGNAFNAVWMSHKQSLYMPEAAMPLIEIMMHELAHGIVSNGSNLAYEFQSGALNESIADSLGVAFRVWRDHADKAAQVSDIPRDFWHMRLPTRVARDMADPQRLNTDNLRFPDHMEFYLNWPKSQDYGGVHFNSSIINLAFYLLSEGGSHPRRQNGITVEGIGIYKAAKIYAQAASKLLLRKSDFKDARYAFAQVAESLFGAQSKEWVAVHKSMDAVGITGDWMEPEPEPEKEPEPVEKSEQETPEEPAPLPGDASDEPVASQGIPTKWVVLIALGGLGLIVAAVALVTMRPKSDSAEKVSYKVKPTSPPVTPSGSQAADSLPSGSGSFTGAESAQLAPHGVIVNTTSSVSVDPQAYSHVQHAPSWWLTSLDGKQRIPLDVHLMAGKEGLVLGRAKQVVHIHLEDKKVSRRHLRLRFDGKTMTVEDLNSTLGTTIDGNRIKPFAPVRISSGQLVLIAEFSYTLTVR